MDWLDLPLQITRILQASTYLCHVIISCTGGFLNLGSKSEMFTTSRNYTCNEYTDLLPA
jgi:hypothetical protein